MLCVLYICAVLSVCLSRVPDHHLQVG